MQLSRPEILRFRFVALWAMLGFQAGYLNAFGFIASSRYVSHLTGFGTQIGVSVASAQWWTAFELFGFPVSFISGAFVSSAWTSARIDRKLRPHYERVTLLILLIVSAIWLAGRLEWIGAFNDTSNRIHDFILLYSLAFACGLQNSCFATLTQGQIKTTHLTGISTDIGIDLARTHFSQLPAKDLHQVKRANLSRIINFLFFSFGSVCSVLLSDLMGYSALCLPVVTALISVIVVARMPQGPMGEGKSK